MAILPADDVLLPLGQGSAGTICRVRMSNIEHEKRVAACKRERCMTRGKAIASIMGVEDEERR